jgi:hypothetical protein
MFIGINLDWLHVRSCWFDKEKDEELAIRFDWFENVDNVLGFRIGFLGWALIIQRIFILSQISVIKIECHICN